MLLNSLWCLFSPEKPGRADASQVDPRAAILCYDVFACLLAWEELQTCSTCSGVCLERHVVSRHALLPWCLSEDTHGQIVEKKSFSLLCQIRALPLCLSAVLLRDKTPTFQFQLCVFSSNFSAMSFRFWLLKTVYSKCFLVLKWILFHFSGLSCVFCIFVSFLLNYQFLLNIG